MLYCVWHLTFHASHVSTPRPVLSRCHGGHIVFWVCMHGLTHEGAIHVDRIITAKKISAYNDTMLNKIVFGRLSSKVKRMLYLLIEEF